MKNFSDFPSCITKRTIQRGQSSESRVGTAEMKRILLRAFGQLRVSSTVMYICMGTRSTFYSITLHGLVTRIQID